jgi:PPK2 family polyphosphate:nucleotide phosphotransferase
MDYRERFFVQPDHKLKLHKIDPDFHGPQQTKDAAAFETDQYLERLAHLQALLAAQREHALLIVLQALDAGGKDGTIKHVFGAFNPQGASVTSFKAPTPDELAHDFLWRIHPHTPGRGQIAIFNRSHYEDVLVTRVHGLIDLETCKQRYRLIRSFERGLVANKTLVLKFFLHISPAEQLARFEQRLEDPTRNWKISASDYAEREQWDAYIAAFEDALSATSTPQAPWYVIPSNHKWFRNLAVSQIVAASLEELHLSFPAPSVDLDEIRRQYHRALEEEQARTRATS